MEKFEYLQFSPKLEGFIKKKPASDTDAELNKLGAEGWNLVSVVPITANMGTSYGGTTGGLIYVFKRPIK